MFETTKQVKRSKMNQNKKRKKPQTPHFIYHKS